MKSKDNNSLNEKNCKDMLENLDKNLNLKTSDELNHISEDARKTIEHYLKLTTETEKRRTDLYTFALKMFTFATSATFAILGLSSNDTTFRDGVTIKYIILFLATIFTSSITTIIFYYFQSTFKYPFNKLTGASNQWKWFYYGNQHIMDISTSPFHKTEKKAKKDSEKYLDGLKYFTENYTTSTPATNAKHNIIQAYLLQVHNYYKNKWVMHLNNIWKYPICISTIIALLLLACDIFDEEIRVCAHTFLQNITTFQAHEEVSQECIR